MSGSGDVALCALSCTAITVPWDTHTCPPRREIPFLLLTVRFCAGKRLKCTLAQGTFGTRVWQGTSGTPPPPFLGGGHICNVSNPLELFFLPGAG